MAFKQNQELSSVKKHCMLATFKSLQLEEENVFHAVPISPEKCKAQWQTIGENWGDFMKNLHSWDLRELPIRYS